jgi:hypothetical protein
MTRIYYLITLLYDNKIQRRLAHSGTIGTEVSKLISDFKLKLFMDEEKFASWVEELNNATDFYEEAFTSYDPDFLLNIETVEDEFTEGDDIDIWAEVYDLQRETEEEDLTEMLEDELDDSEFMNEFKI